MMKDKLAELKPLTEVRKHMPAPYYCKQLCVFALHDEEAFKKAAVKSRQLDPDFAS